MTQKKKTDVASSIFQRLLNQARANKEDFNHILNRYGMERFLYRLSISSYQDEFILKGASLFLVWQSQNYRVTKDADFLGYGDPSPERLADVFKEICGIECSVDDGITYLPESVKAQVIKEEQEYEGVLITLTGLLKQARILIQVDVGFGDVITPTPEFIEYPSLLKQPAPKMRAYPRYTLVAEKTETMVKRGMANSRMKDFYDLWILSKLFDFEGRILSQAIANTFKHRGTKKPGNEPFAFTDEFYLDTQKQTQWKAFVRKYKPKEVIEDFGLLIAEISKFLMPVLGKSGDTNIDEQIWNPGKGWGKSI
ncbi:MAG: nucleotidyl transferase AbiEii/AbiGii toxin family protein [Deltaproteobacteria bacterium]|nr:nucleotidyl transferase AbiEii/AbiGii toxin family protein [Deltaproteobacteria bacterium]